MPQFYRNWDEHAEPYALRGNERPRCLFLAEGLSEALFLERWLTQIGVNPPDIAVVNFRGKAIGVLLRRLAEDEHFGLVDRFGFFMDAEKRNAAQKAASVTDALRRVNVVPPGHNVQAGLLSDVGGKRIALFVSPNNAGPGFIEEISLNELATHQLAQCFNAFGACLSQALGAPPHAKAMVQAFLGVNKPGLCGTGRGFEQGILNVMHAAYDGVRNTLSAVL